MKPVKVFGALEMISAQLAGLSRVCPLFILELAAVVILRATTASTRRQAPRLRGTQPPAASGSPAD